MCQESDEKVLLETECETRAVHGHLGSNARRAESSRGPETDVARDTDIERTRVGRPQFLPPGISRGVTGLRPKSHILELVRGEGETKT